MIRRNISVRAAHAVIIFLLMAGTASSYAQIPSSESVEGPLPAAQPKTLNNDSIIRMVKAKLGDDLILHAIAAQPGDYTTDADTLITLKEAGVSDQVITGMVNKSRRRLTPDRSFPASSSQPVSTQTSPSQILARRDEQAPAIILPEVNEIGVYYKDILGNWVPVDPEIVHIRSGGFIKSTLTRGIIKEDRNGRINGPQAKLTLQAPVEFLIYAPEGVAGSEYDLLKFRLHSDSREFRTLTGGVFHSSGGADRDEVPFAPTRTAPRTYRFTVERKIGGGEFGLLPPGTGNVTNGGKIYTFAITE